MEATPTPLRAERAPPSPGADRTLRAVLATAVARHGGQPVAQFRRGGIVETMTFAALERRVRAAAALAAQAGLQPRGTPAALLLENAPEWLEIYLGLAGCGIPVVPLDPRLRPREIAGALRHAGVTVLFCAESLRATLAAGVSEMPDLRRIIMLGDSPEPPPVGAIPVTAYAPAMAAAADSDWYDRQSVAPEDIASIIYTSGTTGDPKGVMLTHANFCADVDGVLGIIHAIGRDDRLLVVLPLFHAFSFTANLLVALRSGACLQFIESLRTLADDLRAFAPTVLMAVPLLIEKLHGRLDAALRRHRAARLLLALGLGGLLARSVRRALGGRLRLLVTGGAPCPAPLLYAFRRLGLPIIEGYGLTEAAPVVSLSTARRARPGSVGYALPNITVRLDAPDAQGVGELQVRGPMVMRGYYRNPEATALAFDGEWLRTGDLASIAADGYIAIRGRVKALIVNREGKNIYPEEVESSIAAHPLVRDVVVIGVRDGGEVGEKVGAIVVPNLEGWEAATGAPPPEWEAVEARLRQLVQTQCRELADYKRPRRVEVRREPLERTAIQKVRRHLYQGQLDNR